MQNQMQAQDQPNSGGGPVELMVEVGKGLESVLKMMEQAGAPEEVISKMSEIAQGYNSLVGQLPGQQPPSPQNEPVNQGTEGGNTVPVQ